MPSQLIPVAEYLRMSTEHQRYSFDNQATAIRSYADAHNFDVTETYSDSAKSGLMLKNRAALRRLIQEVVGGTVRFKAILVYDISRWGRFPDSDESAYYEFLCKSSGIPVHYCAEPFPNDLSPINLILKTLKRTMASEYSRELGVRTLAGKMKLVKMGFRVGGPAGYGLRRLLVSMDGKPRQVLQGGDRKSLASDRIILVPGPPAEVGNVREMYQMLIKDGRTIFGIAKELNRRGIKNGDVPWTHRAINTIVTHPKYAGFQVFGKSSQRLGGQRLIKPCSEWFIVQDAFEPIIDKRTFVQAQQILTERTSDKSSDTLLDILRSVLAAQGKLSISRLKEAGAPSARAYCTHFGTLHKAYELVGYSSRYRAAFIDTRRKLQLLREQLMNRIENLSCGAVSVVKLHKGHWRSLLRIGEDHYLSVLTARFLMTHDQLSKWSVEPVAHESEMPVLLARLNATNDSFQDYFLFPRIGRQYQFKIMQDSKWLKNGIPVEDLSQLATRLSLVNSESNRCLRKSTIIINKKMFLNERPRA
jgi:DNA invertase Pin-like site-specific DNA recombinase